MSPEEEKQSIRRMAAENPAFGDLVELRDMARGRVEMLDIQRRDGGRLTNRGQRWDEYARAFDVAPSRFLLLWWAIEDAFLYVFGRS